MAKYTGNEATEEVVDLQASMDPTRSECVRPTVLDHLHRQMRSKTWRDKYMELHGMITACLVYCTPNVKGEARKILYEEHELYEDYITKNKDKHDSGVDWGTIEESEFMQRYPFLEKVWFLLHDDLMASGHLPWALSYPEKALDSLVYGQLMDKMEEAKMQEELDRIRKNDPMPMFQTGAGEPRPLALPVKGVPKAEVEKLEKDLSGDPAPDASEDGPSDEEMQAAADKIKRQLEALNKRKKQGTP